MNCSLPRSSVVIQEDIAEAKKGLMSAIGEMDPAEFRHTNERIKELEGELACAENPEAQK